jgi:hypothetical protein
VIYDALSVENFVIIAEALKTITKADTEEEKASTSLK